MAKKSPNFICTDCGDNFSKWFGKCPNCEAFNTIKEFKESKISSTKKSLAGEDLLCHNSELELMASGEKKDTRILTQISEVDRVLGNGFFPGSVVLFGGQPGIGKSTLALQVFEKVKVGHTAFYFSGEESVDQVHNRMQRIMSKSGEVKREREDGIFSTNSLEDIITTVTQNKPVFIVVDSIQMIGLEGSSFGSMSQIRENAEILVKLAKATGTIILLIGHVTKTDELAGPKILEHLVDTVLYLEGEKNSEIRLLRAPKNRFGSTMEIGVFDMQSNGLQELKNPSAYFLAERAEGACGNVICAVREGVRNFLMEVQVLTVKTNFGNPRRTASGIPMSKFHLLLAVISKFTPFKCAEYDAYCNVVGGFKIQDPASDLAITAAILSSRAEKEIPANTVIFGEVGLSGEVRRVPNIDMRLAEISKLGFKKVICPRIPKGQKAPANLEIVEVRHIVELAKSILGK